MVLTVSEVAADLKVQEETVYKLISFGKLQAFKVGNRFRVNTEDLIKFKEEAIEAVRANQNTDRS